MSAQRRTDKAISRFFTGITLLGILLALACAKTTEPPGDEGEGPQVGNIKLLGERPGVANGESFSLEVEAWGGPNDALTYTWSGIGEFDQSSAYENDVTWTLPQSAPRYTEVSCTVSNGSGSTGVTKTFTVGRALRPSNYGQAIGNTITWSNTGDEAPPFYVLYQTVEIPEDRILLITPGTEIYCTEGSALTIRGTLNASGGGASRTEFSAFYVNSQRLDFWEGIRVEITEELISLNSMNVMNARTGLSLAANSTAELNGVGFSRCTKGLEAYTSNVTANSCDVDAGGQGFVLSACEIDLRGCDFRDLTDVALILQENTTGSYNIGAIDNIGNQCITLAGGSTVAFHNLNFFGSGRVLFLSGYDAGDEIDARCNYWGVVSTESEIFNRIEPPELHTIVAVAPYKPVEGGACVDAPEITSGIYIDGENHLYGAEYPEDVNSMGTGSPPRLMRTDVVTQADAAPYRYEWWAQGDGAFFEQPGEDDGRDYPGQADDENGSSIYFLLNSGTEVRIGVRVTDAFGYIAEASQTFTVSP